MRKKRNKQAILQKRNLEVDCRFQILQKPMKSFVIHLPSRVENQRLMSCSNMESDESRIPSSRI